MELAEKAKSTKALSASETEGLLTVITEYSRRKSMNTSKQIRHAVRDELITVGVLNPNLSTHFALVVQARSIGINIDTMSMFSTAILPTSTEWKRNT